MIKKILLLTFLISFCGFSQNLDSIKYELRKIDFLKDHKIKEKTILNIIDSIAIKNSKPYKDTLNMAYGLYVDKKGEIFITYNDINDLKVSETFEYVFSKKYRIKPFKDSLNNNVNFSSKFINRYLKKDSIYIKYIPEKNPFSLAKDIKKIEVVPKFKGCRGKTNKELSICMNKKIGKHIAKNFNINLAQNLGLSVGKKRIFVQFIINKKGSISKVRARAPHPKLRKEAIRIIKLLPKFKPGKQYNMPVNVRYSLPIIFNVEK